jgi:hypothetical protein
MPKKEILKLNSAPRLEQVGDNCPKQMEHRNHCVDDELILLHRANRADGVFGNDRAAVDDGSYISRLPGYAMRRCGYIRN